MPTDLSKLKRYELKYTISESLAAEIRDYIRGFFKLDEHVPSGEDGYIVNNLYFDTPDLRFYFDTRFRKLIRYKLRARFYGEKSSDYIWPEIKYRHGPVIWKTRRKIPMEEWPQLFLLQRSEQQESVRKSGLDSFEELVHWYGAQPVLHVRYYREPYVTQLETYGRVTFDRRLTYSMAEGSIDVFRDGREMIYYDDPLSTLCHESPIVLEIKVERLVPFWVIDMVRQFGLVQRPFSKYCYGIDNNRRYLSTIRSSFIKG